MARLSVPGVLDKESEGSIFFVSMDKVKFRRPVVPGDQLILELEAMRTGSKVWKMSGKAFVGTELAAEGVLVATIG